MSDQEIKQRVQEQFGATAQSYVTSPGHAHGDDLARMLELASPRGPEHMLDIATGGGHTALAFAPHVQSVVASDLTPAMLAAAEAFIRGRGAANVRFERADAEALPFADASFDVVLSTYGIMFAPDQPRAAAESARVARRGGRIGLANWTPDGFIGELFKVVGAHVPPPAGLTSPAAWGTMARLHELYDGLAEEITLTPRDFVFRYRSAAHWIDVFRDFYGPVHRAFLALGPAEQAALQADLAGLLARHDRGGRRGLVVPARYAEVVITLKS